MKWSAKKREILLVAKKTSDLGLVTGSSGNISVRLPGRDLSFAITTMGSQFDNMTEDNIAIVDYNLIPVENELTPSSESFLHKTIYENISEVRGIIHTHPVYSSIISVSQIEIPPIIDEMVISLGGTIRVSKYAPPASIELGHNVCQALSGRSSAIISNHGLISIGSDLKSALDSSILTEKIAKIYVYSSLIGKVSQIPSEVADSESEIFKMQKEISSNTDDL